MFKRNGLRQVCFGIFALLPLWVGGCLPDSFIVRPIHYREDLEPRMLESAGMFVRDKIALIEVDGVILNAAGNSLFASGEHPVAYLLEQLDAARDNPHVRAVVLRINSPGGSVTASELMHTELMRFRETGKPIVVMMLDVAASGGYYIACAADRIVASRSTVTGSIGVIMQTFDATGTMQKIGIRADAIKSGSQKGAGSPFESMTPEQRDVFQDMVNELYGQFVTVVSDGRALPVERVRELADGRIYTAQQALANGLIDEIGSMQDALATARRLAGVERASLITYTRPHGFEPNYYAKAPAAMPGAQVNLLNVDFGNALTGARPPFMYLWIP